MPDGAAQPRLSVVARRFTTVRSRLLALILLAAIPLVAMAVSIAWQNYRMVADASLQRARLLLTAAAARNDAVLDQAARLLAGIARDSATQQGEGACEVLLGAMLRIFGDRYRELGLSDPQGVFSCRAAAPALAGEPLPIALRADALRRDAFTIGAVTVAQPGSSPMLAVAAPWHPGAAGKGGLASARLRIDWLVMPAAQGLAAPAGVAWLVDSRQPGGLIEVGRLAGAPVEPGAEPPPSVLAGLLQPGAALQLAPGANGRAYAYAAAPLRGGAMLLLAVPAGADIERADAVLGRRLAELGLLLLAGLVLVALGGRLLVVRPVAAMSRAVRIWRDGGLFDPGPLDGAPAELVELATTFAAAGSALRVRETELREAALRQDLLMQEIHHRVKNNLQIIASLLNLQASRIRLPEARAEFQTARDRIRALATLHRHLYANDQLHSINMRNFLAELCGQLLAAIGETPAGGRIRLDIEAPELRISSDQAVPMALIVTEAVSNAAKYAFPGGRSGHIRVRLEVDADSAETAQQVRLLIEDDGVGIPAGRADTEAGVRDGIGIQLIRGFARQLGAALTVTQEGGTRYVLDIPLHRDRDVAAPEEPSEA